MLVKITNSKRLFRKNYEAQLPRFFANLTMEAAGSGSANLPMTIKSFALLAASGLIIDWLLRRGLRWALGREAPLARDALTIMSLYPLSLWAMDWMGWDDAALWSLLLFCVSGLLRELTAKGVIG